MSKVLWTKKGAETSMIDVAKRNSSVHDFFELLFSKKNIFCMENDAFNGLYSYGTLATFLYSSWEDFRVIDSLRGIEYNTYDFVVNGFQHHFPLTVLKPKQLFDDLPYKHKGQGGFNYPGCSESFITNRDKYEEWEINYFISHPDDIDWTHCCDPRLFMPQAGAINQILSDAIDTYIAQNLFSDAPLSFRRELVKKHRDSLFKKKEYHSNDNPNEPLKKNATALVFHREIMHCVPRGGPRQGYCIEIADKVCRANYYAHDAKLSSSESQASGTQRRIYCVTKKGNKQYISLDFEKGLFEFHDSGGVHLGEFFFDGSLNDSADPSHNLRTLLD